jgi:hypothetical protein
MPYDLPMFAGIDPGREGGIAVLDAHGGFLAAHRWTDKEPARLYRFLASIAPTLTGIYLEKVRVFPREEVGFITNNQGLLVNSGIWQGWMIALNIPFVELDPATWQVATGLHHWRKNLERNPRALTPLTLARQLWPSAPLQYEPDSGKAVALILADLCRKDHRLQISRVKVPTKKPRKPRKVPSLLEPSTTATRPALPQQARLIPFRR